MKKLFIVIAVICAVGCANLNRKPTQWVRVIDIESNDPVANLPLVYHEIAKPYFIVGHVISSREYVSNENGYVKIPSRVCMIPSFGSTYRYADSEELEKYGKEHNGKIIYVANQSTTVEPPESGDPSKLEAILLEIEAKQHE